MNAEEKLDYAFGLLDDPRRDDVESDLADDPALSSQLARLSQNIRRLVDDDDTIVPPADLAARTIALVVERRHSRSFLELVPTRVPFRWGDVAVAAMVFLASVLTLTVPLHRSRSQMDQALCSLNLQQVGIGLSKYATAFGSFPFPPPKFPAGSFAVMLSDFHALPDPAVRCCPRGTLSHPHAHHQHPPLPDMKRFEELVDRSPGMCHDVLCGQYAYHSGFRTAAGGLVPVPDPPLAHIPIASDQPPHDLQGRILAGNSLNHGGGGQNVLFTDGHVRWMTGRWISKVDPDIFLNNAGRPAPGLEASDSAIIPSTFPLGGK